MSDDDQSDHHLKPIFFNLLTWGIEGNFKGFEGYFLPGVKLEI